MAEGIDDTAEPDLGRIDGADALLECRAGTEGDSFKLSERHGERAAVAEAYDLAGGLPAVGAGELEPTAEADCPGSPRNLDQEPFQPGHTAKAGEPRYGFDAVDQSFHKTPKNLSN